MKSIVNSIASGLLAFMFVYAIGAFVCWDTNAGNWGVNTRTFVGLFGGALGVLTAAIAMDLTKLEK